jgi:mRNA interferase RelE/StbE
MTTPYHIRIAPKARRQVKDLPQKDQKNMIKAIESLAINPRPQGAKKIEGLTGLYSEMVGAHRVIYKIEDQEVLILLMK